MFRRSCEVRRFRTGTRRGYYVITRNLWTYRLKIDNAVYSPVFNDVNGFIYWKDNSNFFYYSKAYGWILHNRFPGYEPREDYNPETLMYEGDAFHSGYFLPSAYDNAYVFLQPRGTNRNGGGAERTRPSISIFPAGRALPIVNSAYTNRKAKFPGKNISVFPAGGTTAPTTTSDLWKRRTDAFPTEKFITRAGNGFWES